jgi:putative endonuclease
VKATTSPYYYVYILQSLSELDCYYTGITQDLEKRMKDHNAGFSTHTAKYRPWRIKTYTAFTDFHQASKFELYLKSASGRAFAKKRL